MSLEREYQTFEKAMSDNENKKTSRNVRLSAHHPNMGLAIKVPRLLTDTANPKR
jgi:hypothetical protein